MDHVAPDRFLCFTISFFVFRLLFICLAFMFFIVFANEHTLLYSIMPGLWDLEINEFLQILGDNFRSTTKT